jgi:hypothetical protein
MTKERCDVYLSELEDRFPLIHKYLESEPLHRWACSHHMVPTMGAVRSNPAGEFEGCSRHTMLTFEWPSLLSWPGALPHSRVWVQRSSVHEGIQVHVGGAHFYTGPLDTVVSATM